MQLRYRVVLPLAAFCLALVVAPAFAAKPAPSQVADVVAPPVGHQLGEVNSTATICQMGVLGPPTIAWAYILPPDDVYFTLLRPDQCPSCPHDRVYLLTAAHVQLFYTEPCAIPVTVSIVPAFESSPGCLAPDVAALPLCPPVQYLLDDGGIINGCIDYTLPLPGGCCMDRPAFLRIEFDQGSCRNGRPAFCGHVNPAACNQYNLYPGGYDDLGVLVGNDIIMNVDADCCTPTATLPGTWGMVKTLYR